MRAKRWFWMIPLSLLGLRAEAQQPRTIDACTGESVPAPGRGPEDEALEDVPGPDGTLRLEARRAQSATLAEPGRDPLGFFVSQPGHTELESLGIVRGDASYQQGASAPITFEPRTCLDLE
jgi:hypothetical protein